MKIDKGQEILTAKQQAVVEQLAFRKPIKQIAFELGISPSTVKEHIRAARRRLDASSVPELVARWNEVYADTRPFRTGPNGRVESGRDLDEPQGRDDTTQLGNSDASVYSAPPVSTDEPSVVPEELDGSSAIVPRLVAIAKITGGLLAAFVLAITSFEAISKLLTG